jgi:eukaryotic translation initiation factor 2C
MESHNGEADELPPPPPLAPDCEPIKAEETKVSQKPKRMLVPRNGFGRKGQQIKLCTNHFKVSLKTADEFFHHYYVSLHHWLWLFLCADLILVFYLFQVNLKYEDDRPVDGKGVGRKVIDKLQQTYAAELANKDFAYDGEKSLFTIGALPQVNNEFTVVLEDVSTGK